MIKHNEEGGTILDSFLEFNTKSMIFYEAIHICIQISRLILIKSMDCVHFNDQLYNITITNRPCMHV